MSVANPKIMTYALDFSKYMVQTSSSPPSCFEIAKQVYEQCDVLLQQKTPTDCVMMSYAYCEGLKEKNHTKK